MKKDKTIKVQCAHCGRVLSGRVIKSSDVSIWVPRIHKIPLYDYRPDIKQPCPGNIKEAKITP